MFPIRLPPAYPAQTRKLPRRRLIFQASVFLIVTILIFLQVRGRLTPLSKRPTKHETFLRNVLQSTSMPETCKKFIDHSVLPLSPLPNKPSSKVPEIAHFIHYNQHLQNPKYLCAISSFAAKNPKHEIRVHVTNRSNFIAETPSNLFTPNTRILETSYTEVFEGTPLEAWQTDAGTKGKWIAQNLGNALRLALLYRYGGVYMDLDIISINPVPPGRLVAFQDGNSLNNAFLAFEKEDPVVWWMMEEFVSGFRGDIWGRNGPEVVTRTWKKYCAGKEKNDECDGVQILPKEAVYPFGYKRKHLMFESWDGFCEDMEAMSRQSVGLHWWNRRAKEVEVMSNRSVLAIVMQAHCPALFEELSEGDLGIDANAVLGAAKLTAEDPELMRPKQKNRV